MKALQALQLGEPRDVLQLTEVEAPVPTANQILVRVLGAAANFPDVLLCRGTYQVKAVPPFTPGIEMCGEIAVMGAEVVGFVLGDRVIGSSVLPNGGFAEYGILDATCAFHAPPTLDDAEAAAFLVGYQTSWFGLHRRARLRPGETLLVHAAAGGVGSAAIQLGKAAGARVIAVVGGDAKAKVARVLGADVVVDRHTEDFVTVANAVTDGRGVDVIYDPVGGDTYRRSTKCIAFEGRIVVVGFAGGEVQSTALNHALLKNYSIIGLHWGRYTTEDPTRLQLCHQELCRLTANGMVRPLVSERHSLSTLPEGMQRLAEGTTVGRVAYVA